MRILDKAPEFNFTGSRWLIVDRPFSSITRDLHEILVSTVLEALNRKYSEYHYREIFNIYPRRVNL